MIQSIALGLIGLLAADVAVAQEPSRNEWGYNFAPFYDAEVAAPAVHRVRYADTHIVLMEVANPPGYPMQMHGHPYPSIFARSSGSTHLGGGGPSDQYLEPDSGRNGEHWHSAPPPPGTPSLECTAADPQAPHRPVNRGMVPQHFYRIEFKALDKHGQVGEPSRRHGEADRKLYENDVVRLFEVTALPGLQNHSHPLANPSVLAFDSARSFELIDRAAGLGPGRSLPPTGLSMPRCITVDRGVSLAADGPVAQPLHYYRLEFKRIEGDALKDHWREWYPFMTTMN